MSDDPESVDGPVRNPFSPVPTNINPYVKAGTEVMFLTAVSTLFVSFYAALKGRRHLDRQATRARIILMGTTTAFFCTGTNLVPPPPPVRTFLTQWFGREPLIPGMTPQSQ